MARVVFLSDILVSGRGSVRYPGPYALASFLERNGYDCQVLDYFTRLPDFPKVLESHIDERTQVVGISSTFLTPLPEADVPSGSTSTGRAQIAVGDYWRGELWMQSSADFVFWMDYFRNFIKARAPNAKIVLGGAKTLQAVKRPQNYRAFDYIIMGAGEWAMLYLLQELEAGREPSTIDQDGLRVVDYSAYKDEKICPSIDWKREWAVQPGEALPIEISRGCKFNCKFCHYEKKSSLIKDLNQLRDEFISNYERFGTTAYHFSDDCFNDSREKVEEVCNLILTLPFKIEWMSYARVDVAIRFPHTLDLMIESGARALFWGIESFTDEVARRAGKGTPSIKVKEFLLNFKRQYAQQCLTQGSFIVGLPGETVETQRQTIDWVSEHVPFDFITIAPLGLIHYKASLDMKVLDFADYARNPTKYGFTWVSPTGGDWRHETMSRKEADQLCGEFQRAWDQRIDHGPIRTMWIYPHLRTLGFDQDEAWLIMTKASGAYVNEIKKRYWAHLARYSRDLISRGQSFRPELTL